MVLDSVPVFWLVMGHISIGSTGGKDPGRSRLHLFLANVDRSSVRVFLLSPTTQADGRNLPVVLGGDRPIGLPLILDLEKKGYIVITSVGDSASVESIESKTHGYVRALVLEPANVRSPSFNPLQSAELPRSPLPFRCSSAR